MQQLDILTESKLTEIDTKKNNTTYCDLTHLAREFAERDKNYCEITIDGTIYKVELTLESWTSCPHRYTGNGDFNIIFYEMDRCDKLQKNPFIDIYCYSSYHDKNVAIAIDTIQDLEKYLSIKPYTPALREIENLEKKYEHIDAIDQVRKLLLIEFYENMIFYDFSIMKNWNILAHDGNMCILICEDDHTYYCFYIIR